MVSDTRFELSKGAYVQAFHGSANRELIKLTSLGPYLAVPHDDDGYFNFTDSNCNKVEITCNGEIISSESNSITWLDGELYCKFGDFTFTTGSYTYNIIGYFDGDTTEGVVLCSVGRVNFNTK